MSTAPKWSNQFERLCFSVLDAGSQRAHYCCKRHGSNCYGLQDYGSDFSERFDCFEDEWQRDWSTEKKDWCCEREGRGCQYDCDGDVHFWAAAQSQWCCENAQICSPDASAPTAPAPPVAPAAPAAQVGPVGPVAPAASSPCVRSCITRGDGEEVKSTCIDRIHWAEHNFFAGKESSCALAYSRVQVDCDVCRDCSIQVVRWRFTRCLRLQRKDSSRPHRSTLNRRSGEWAAICRLWEPGFQTEYD
eukprot:s3102_g12.t1